MAATFATPSTVIGLGGSSITTKPFSSSFLKPTLSAIFFEPSRYKALYSIPISIFFLFIFLFSQITGSSSSISHNPP
jgi:hypothetical protein